MLRMVLNGRGGGGGCLCVFAYGVHSASGFRTWIKKETSGLPWWLSGEESTCQCRRHGFNPSSGRTPACPSHRTPAVPLTPLHFTPSSQNSFLLSGFNGHFSLISEHIYQIHFIRTHLLSQQFVSYALGLRLSCFCMCAQLRPALWDPRD